jgi:phosphoribosylaminoimidazole-succinocarboxamide synthase
VKRLPVEQRPEAYCVCHTNFQFKSQFGKYQGKVRDVYDIGDRLIVITTDRISAFDHVLPRPIPYKGQVLNQIAGMFLDQTRSIVPNWLIEMPDPNVAVGWKCQPIKIEMVVRAYLAGHAWRLYSGGQRVICGVRLPDGMVQNQAFEKPIITPTTKADAGHDQDVSLEELRKARGMNVSLLDDMCEVALRLFEYGSQWASGQGLLLVDTKYEFGLRGNELMLMDEIHTPDSSRYFEKDPYEQLLAEGLPQRQLSKEFVREWLMSKGFQGLSGQQMPVMPDAMVWMVAERYLELYERITGKSFAPPPAEPAEARLSRNLAGYF